MTARRSGEPGATRSCPHCKTTILESMAVCPACRHHVRFDQSANLAARPTRTALRIEGRLQQPEGETSEYHVLVTIRDDAGSEIARELIGVGAMQPGESRTFTLAVETTADGRRPRRPGIRH